MTRFSLRAALCAASAALIFASGAYAQSATQLSGGTITGPSGRPVELQGVQIVSYDTVTHLPCIVGSSATCQTSGQMHVDLQAVIAALGSPFQVGGSIGNTYFGARLQDASGAAFGTSGNPVVTSLPGGATAARQDTSNASAASIDGKLTGVAAAANQTAVQANAGSDASKAVAVQGITGGKAVGISAASLPLPAGAALDASVLANGAKLDTIHADRQDARTAAANITAADVGTTSTAGQNSVNQVTGSPTANSSLTWAVNGQSSVAITVANTFSAACTIETSADAAATYVASTAKQLGTAATSSAVTGAGTFRVDVTGATNVRLRCPTFTSGTLSAYATASPAPGLTQVLNPVPLMGTDGLTKASLSNGIAAAQAFATVSTSPVTGVLVSSTLTNPFTPPTPRGSYLELTGTGTAAAVTVEFLCNDGTTYAAEVLGTDGGAPTVMNDVAYNGGVRNGVRIPIEVSRAGQVVKVLPGTVTGTVNFAFVPGN